MSESEHVEWINEPWLTAIVKGRKTHEGRLQGSEWSKRKKGDRVVVKSKAWDRVELEVTEVLAFTDFGAAWEKLGTALLPDDLGLGVSCAEDARDVYRVIPKANYTDEKIKARGGVVTVGVKVVSSFRYCVVIKEEDDLT